MELDRRGAIVQCSLEMFQASIGLSLDRYRIVRVLPDNSSDGFGPQRTIRLLIEEIRGEHLPVVPPGHIAQEADCPITLDAAGRPKAELVVR